MNKRLKTILFAIVVIAFAFFVLNSDLVNLKTEGKISANLEIEDNVLGNLECVSRAEEKIVRGESLAGLIEPNETVKIFFGYYDCNEIKKGDIVAYNYTGNPVPIIKVVKGIPGDKFYFQEVEDGWYILINEEILKNSYGQSYILDKGGYRMLSLYKEDYKGIIPKNTYLIMGNLVTGASDSTRFGLVHKDDFFGIVISEEGS